MSNLRLLALAPTLAALFLLTSCRAKKTNPAISTVVIARSRLSDGNLARLQRVLAKARRGEAVTIGFIGGSITRGERATIPDRQYANLVTRWWVDQFPRTPITLVNAGVSGTNSMYACLRAQRDLISKHPDFVVVEFAVNDPAPPQDLFPDSNQENDERAHHAMEHAQTYEGLVRQLLADADQPAVMLLFLMHTDGTNAQQLQSEIGRRYRLAMISYRDALWPEIAAGRMQLSDVFYDHPHPNDRGHAAIATFITSLLQQTLDRLPPDAAIPEAPADLPGPCTTDLFAHTALIDAADLHPVFNDGWSYDPAGQVWRSNTPKSAIEFQITAQSIDLLYEKHDGGFGMATVTVDGGTPTSCDSWLNGSWGPLCQVDRVALGTRPEKHRVRVEVLTEKNPLSSGNEFRILGFGAAGQETDHR